MEDKLNNDSDSFKKIIKDKIKDEAQSSAHDELLWNKVFAEIQPQTKSTSKVRPMYWYASAAMVILGLTLAYLFTKTNTSAPKQIVHTKPSSAPNYDQSSQKIVADSLAGPTNTIEQKTVAPSSKNLSLEQRIEVIDAKDEVLNHTLHDGSIVTLNAESYITTTYAFGKTREVTVNGEAYFEVVKDPSRPFIVHFGDYRLEVVGTKFNVRNLEKESQKEITVTEGIVKVFENNQSVQFVKAGEQLKLQKKKESVLSHVEAINFISWKTNVLDFKNSRLEDVAHILTRLHHQSISVDTPLKDCIFSGDLTGLKLDESLEIIKLSSNLTIEKKKHQIHLAGHGCD